MAKFTKKVAAAPVVEETTPITPVPDTTETVKDVAVAASSPGKQRLAQAMAFANHKQDHVVAEINKIIQGKDDVDLGTFRMVEALEADFVTDENPDALDVIPNPKAKTGNNTPKFKVWEQKVDGKYGDVEKDWFTIVTESGPIGKPWAERRDHLKTLDNPKANMDQVPEDLRKQFSGDLFARRDALKEASNRVATIRSAYVRAANFMYQWAAVESVPRIALKVNADAKGNVRNGAPIQVYECKVDKNGAIMTDADGEAIPAMPLQGDSVTLSTFNRYQPAMAIELGGGYEALRKSLARQGEGEQTPADALTIKTPETFDKVFTKLVERCEEMATAHDAEDFTALIKRLNTKGADNMVLAIYNMRAFCDDVLRKDKLMARAVRLSQSDGDDTAPAKPAEEKAAA